MIDTQNSRLNLIFTLWFLAVAVIPSALLAFFTVRLENVQLERSVSHELALVSRLKSQQFNSFAAYTLQGMDRMIDQALSGSDAMGFLHRMIDGTPGDQSARLFLVDANGTVLYPLGREAVLDATALAEQADVPFVSIEPSSMRFFYPVPGTAVWLLQVMGQDAVNSLLHEHINDARYFSRGSLLGIRSDLGTTADMILFDDAGRAVSDSLLLGTIRPDAPLDASFSEWIKQSRDTVLSGTRMLAGREVVAYAQRLDLFGQRVVFLATVDRAEVAGRLYDQRRDFVLTYIAAMVAILLLLYFFVRMTSRGIIRPIQVTIKDAVTSAGKIRESMRRAQQTIEDQQNVARELSDNYSKQLDAIKAVDSEIRTIVDSLADISKQTQGTLRTVQSIETLARRSQEGAEEAQTSIGSIKRLATLHDSLLATLKQYSLQVDRIATDVRRLAESTKYLSLNAAIEAGQSEGGTRHLSGLVSEVGKLSVLGTEASVGINELVRVIQQQLAQSRESSSRVREEAESSLGILHEALERLSSMSDDAVKIAERVRVIDDAVTRQSQSTVEISGHSKDITTQARATLRTATQVQTLIGEQARGIAASSAAQGKLDEIIAKLTKLIGAKRDGKTKK